MIVFICSLFYVGLKSAQQLNVQHGKRLWIFPVSLGMAYMECKIIGSLVMEPSEWNALPLGLGAGCGCLVAMEIHRRLRR